MPDPTITTLAVATGGAFLGKFVGPAAEHYGKLALERAQQLGARATALLAQVGREPQPVEPKLLLPLVQAASLETDEALTAHWAALLANAADPAQKVQVQPGFAEVLRQLTPEDAQVLQALATIEPHPKSLKAGYLALSQLLPQVAPLTQQRLLLVTSNLTRLGICLSGGRQDIQSNQMLAPPPRHNTLGPGVDYIRIAPFGFAFLMAVTPPTP